jgi:hypothetical protein
MRNRQIIPNWQKGMISMLIIITNDKKDILVHKIKRKRLFETPSQLSQLINKSLSEHKF